MTHRMDISNLTFPSHAGILDVFADDVKVNALTGIGESTANVSITNGAGSFAKNSTTHSIRGSQEDGPTVAMVNQNTGNLDISIGVGQPGSSWQSGGV